MSVNSDATDSTACKQCPEEPQPPTELTEFQRDLLIVIERLSDDRSSGVTIRRQLDQYHDSEVNYGQLYQNLRKLIEEECIKKQPLDGGTNMCHRLTDFGRAQTAVYSKRVADCVEDSEIAAMKGEGHR